MAAFPTTSAQGGSSTSPRHIVILNWRDIAHPQAGGAEKVTHEIARRWVAWGHCVTQFSAGFRGGACEECLDGVHVVRRGHRSTVHWEAYRHYPQLVRGGCDVIIDQVNTIPFLTPLYVREPVIMFSHQLARDVWRYEAPFPLSVIGYLTEPAYLQVYRRTPIMTVSQSTRDDLRRLGLWGPCHIISEAVDTQPLAILPSLEIKERDLTLVFVGRVVPSKRVDHIIQALGLIHRHGHTRARLWVIGAIDPHYGRTLQRTIAAAGLNRHVTFFGRVDDACKEQLLARAHVLVMTSVREGWGLAVTEANMVGTPAVVYDVPGLRDSTRDGETGLVCRQTSPKALAGAIVALQANPMRYAHLRQRAWDMARELNWDRTAQEAWAVVERYALPGRVGHVK